MGPQAQKSPAACRRSSGGGAQFEPVVIAAGGFDHYLVDDGTGRPLPQPGVLPKIGAMTTGIRRAGPAIGADGDAVLGEAGFTTAEIAGFRRSGAVWA